MNRTFAILSLGCKVNQYDSQALSEELVRRGFVQVPFNQSADVYVVNTCTVTGMSDRKSRQMLRRTKKQNPNSILAVMGCYSQLSPEAVCKMEETDIIWGTRHRELLPDAIEQALNNPVGSKIRSDMLLSRHIDPTSISHMPERCRAYIKVEDGCNRYCTYCAIPYARGPVCSREPGEILAEARRLANEGCREIVIIGINLGVYGRDLPSRPTLPQVIAQLAEIPGILRIRLGSMEPDMVNEEFLRVLASTPKLCSHFHMALQSGCDNQLQAMNRRYTCGEFEDYCRKLRKIRPEAAICTDIMVGFPGESREDFAATKEFLKKINFAAMHVFKYSRRPGTKADTMPDQVDEVVKNSRSEELIRLGAEMSNAFNSTLIGKDVEVLAECRCDGVPNMWEGHTGNYVSVRFCCDRDLTNQAVIVHIAAADREYAYGTIENMPF